MFGPGPWNDLRALTVFNLNDISLCAGLSYDNGDKLSFEIFC